MERVAGSLEVWLTLDTNEIVLSHPDLKKDAPGGGRIVFSPRHARHLANLLLAYAAAAEAESSDL